MLAAALGQDRCRDVGSWNQMNHLLLMAAAILFSTGGAVIKLSSLTEWQVASLRSAIAAAALLAFQSASRQNWSLRTVPVAFFYAATLVLFVVSTKTTTAANAIFLQATAPLYLLFLGPLLLGERLRKSDLLFGGAVALGMTLFFAGAQAPQATAPNPGVGNWTAAASGFTWAMTVTGLRSLGRSGGATRVPSAVVIGNLLAFAGTIGMALPMARPSLQDVAVVSYLGIVQIAVAYILFSRAIQHVPAFEAATVLLLEPVFNPIWTWWIHGEKPGTLAVVGGGVILSATL